MSGTNTLNFTEAGWDTEVLKSDQPVLVDFWATWCGPCRAMTPIIDQLATDYAGKARIGKLNVDENPQVAARYQVRGIPTMLLFKNGALVASKVGSTNKGELQKLIDAHVAAPAADPVQAA
jgi:thioredoxin 1